jgi:adenine-specific DNA-methyltransferase
MNVELRKNREHQAEFGQFMTAPAVAQFMASWLDVNNGEIPHILDAGAGLGGLSHALLHSWKNDNPVAVEITAFEIDPSLSTLLPDSFSDDPRVSLRLYQTDYIEHSVGQVATAYTHAILNPPYKKIGSNSRHRKLLRSVGIETGNLYSAFVALALRELKSGGQLVAIIPRSFCNGPYFRPFRKFILETASLTNIHLFGSRKDAFKEDGVLQENIIIRLVKAGTQSGVKVSFSSTSDFSDMAVKKYAFNQIVKSDDADKFIHIPTPNRSKSSKQEPDSRCTLEHLGAQLSTGPVVSFRLREHLRDNLDTDCAPLIYPTHLRGGRVRWPLEDGKKPNAIDVNHDTQKWLYPNGFYCVVRRFSSKEERHRIVASVVEPSDFGSVEFLGFDNKLNVFHVNKSGLSKELAYGLSAYLNTDLVDDEFRSFSGHTQVNATDLRKMEYPDRAALVSIGKRIIDGQNLEQEQIYRYFNKKKKK